MGQGRGGRGLVHLVVAFGRPLVAAQPADEHSDGAEEPGGLSRHPQQATTGVQIGEADARGDPGRLALEGHAEDGVAGQEEDEIEHPQPVPHGLSESVDADRGPEEHAPHDERSQIDEQADQVVVEGVGVERAQVQHEEGKAVDRPGHRRLGQDSGRRALDDLLDGGADPGPAGLAGQGHGRRKRQEDRGDHADQDVLDRADAEVGVDVGRQPRDPRHHQRQLGYEEGCRARRWPLHPPGSQAAHRPQVPAHA